MANITKKSENISSWYNDVVLAAKLAEHGPARGTIIIRPYGYAIWEEIQRNLDAKIKSFGVDNAYFPLFIPNSLLQKEKSHVEGFSPELAVVTHGGGEELAEPLVVRPTSETIMYDAFSRWIASYRDLPLKINQWNNVVRWEKRPYLFLRGTEFLWQEGHTAHATHEDAIDMARKALDAYIDTYQNQMALFGYAGRKSESEKFAGADVTYTYETLMPDGKIVQSCTSHDLGQNFAKAFNIKFQDQNSENQYVWQTSWGLSTRSIGVLILAHGDDNGLILPPAVAPFQVVIIPIHRKGDHDPPSPTASGGRGKIGQLIQRAFEVLETAGLRVKVDVTENSPGWKFNEADLQGIPVRIEIGALEAREEKVKVVVRWPASPGANRGEPETRDVYNFGIGELAQEVEKLLSMMQKDLLQAHKDWTEANTREVSTYDEFKEIMGTVRGFIKAYWCEDAECEAKIKEETKATVRVLEFAEEASEVENECVHCGTKAPHRWLFGQSY